MQILISSDQKKKGGEPVEMLSKNDKVVFRDYLSWWEDLFFPFLFAKF